MRNKTPSCVTSVRPSTGALDWRLSDTDWYESESVLPWWRWEEAKTQIQVRSGTTHSSSNVDWGRGGKTSNFYFLLERVGTASTIDWNRFQEEGETLIGPSAGPGKVIRTFIPALWYLHGGGPMNLLLMSKLYQHIQVDSHSLTS